DQRLDVDVVGIGSRPTLNDVQRVAMRVGVLVDPDLLLFEADGVDDERVSLPTAQLLAEKRRIGIVGVLAVGVDRDQAEVAVPIQENDLFGAFQNFEGQGRGIFPGESDDDAETLRIDRGREIVLERGFPGWRQWQFESWQILADVSDWRGVARPLPITAEVRMPIR